MNGKGGKVPSSVARHSTYNAIALEQIKNELMPYETGQSMGGSQVCIAVGGKAARYSFRCPFHPADHSPAQA